MSGRSSSKTITLVDPQEETQDREAVSRWSDLDQKPQPIRDETQKPGLKTTLLSIAKKFSSPFKQHDGQYVLDNEQNKQIDWTVVGAYVVLLVLFCFLFGLIFYAMFRKGKVSSTNSSAPKSQVATTKPKPQSSFVTGAAPKAGTTVEAEPQRGRRNTQKDDSESKSTAVPQREEDEKDPSLKALAKDLFSDLPSDYYYEDSKSKDPNFHISFEPEDEMPSRPSRFSSAGAESMSMEIDAYNPATYGEDAESDDLVDAHTRSASKFAHGSSDFE
jgi:hypothetical protein